jgi:hypothetical protein
MTQMIDNEITIETSDMTIKVIGRIFKRGMTTKEYYSKTRVYVWQVADLPEMKLVDATLPTPKDHGVDLENDKAYARRNRLYAKLTREAAERAIAILSEQLGFTNDMSEIKCRFSRHAGCSCPCSPGVIASQRLRVASNSRGVDIYVTLKIGS